MEIEEQEIIDYMQAHPKEFLSIKEISRFVKSSRKHEDELQWAAPFLKNMLQKGWVEADAMNHYRILKVAILARKGKIHVSPRMAAILKSSGKDFSDRIILQETDETMESFMKNLPSQSPNKNKEADGGSKQ